MQDRDFLDHGHDATSPERAPWFACFLSGPELAYAYVNDAYRTLFGARDFVGRPIRRIMAEFEGQRFFGEMQRVYESGETHRSQAQIVLGGPGEHGRVRQVEYTFAATRNERSEITGLAVEGRLWKPPESAKLPVSGRAEQFGVKSLTDQELLAAFLDDEDDDRSKELLDRFGNLRRVFSASTCSLRQLRPATTGGARGLRPRSVLRVNVAREIHRRLMLQQVSSRPVLSSSRRVHEYLRSALAGEPREQFHVLFLDGALKLIADEMMNEGTISHVAVYRCEVLRRALELSASSLILVHNHPGGSTRVSPQDVQITRDVRVGAASVDIVVHDHLIVAGDAVISVDSTACTLARSPSRRRDG